MKALNMRYSGITNMNYTITNNPSQNNAAIKIEEVKTVKFFDFEFINNTLGFSMPDLGHDDPKVFGISNIKIQKGVKSSFFYNA